MRFIKTFNTIEEYQDFITLDTNDQQDIEEYNNTFVTPHLAFIKETRNAFISNSFSVTLDNWDAVNIKVINTKNNEIIITSNEEIIQFSAKPNTKYQILKVYDPVEDEGKILNEEFFITPTPQNNGFSVQSYDLYLQEITLYMCKGEIYRSPNYLPFYQLSITDQNYQSDYILEDGISVKGLNAINEKFRNYAIENNAEVYLQFTSATNPIRYVGHVYSTSTDQEITNTYGNSISISEDEWPSQNQFKQIFYERSAIPDFKFRSTELITSGSPDPVSFQYYLIYTGIYINFT